MTWQPIETAPYDAAMIVFDGSSVTAAYHGKESGWNTGWTALGDDYALELKHMHGPFTHWQPLPDPPEQGA